MRQGWRGRGRIGHMYARTGHSTASLLAARTGRRRWVKGRGTGYSTTLPRVRFVRDERSYRTACSLFTKSYLSSRKGRGTGYSTTLPRVRFGSRSLCSGNSPAPPSAVTVLVAPAALTAMIGAPATCQRVGGWAGGWRGGHTTQKGK